MARAGMTIGLWGWQDKSSRGGETMNVSRIFIGLVALFCSVGGLAQSDCADRATALFPAGDFKRSLADCDQVMKRNTNHFGALSGYGQIYFQLEQYEKAITYWKRALKVNPNLGVEDNIEIAEKMLAAQRRNTV